MSCIGSNSWRGDFVVVEVPDGLAEVEETTEELVDEDSEATLSKAKRPEFSARNCGLYSLTFDLPPVITTISPLPFISFDRAEEEEAEEYFPRGLFIFL